jgi:glycerol uptake facilitator-like aquaporin
VFSISTCYANQRPHLFRAAAVQALVGALCLFGTHVKSNTNLEPVFAPDDELGENTPGTFGRGTMAQLCTNALAAEDQSTPAVFLAELLACFFICVTLLAVVDPVTQLSPTSGPHVIGMAVAAVHLCTQHIVRRSFLNKELHSHSRLLLNITRLLA